MTSLIDAVDALFADTGRVASLPGLDYREQQHRMAVAVAAALDSGSHLIVEAPTGIGKSLAYLVPSLLFAQSHERPAVVSTHTRTLQEQLLRNDLPLVTRIIGTAPRAVVLKGRRNYLCTTRLRTALEGSRYLFDDSLLSELERVAAWATTTADGDAEHLGFVPRQEVWDAVCSERGSCSRGTCGTACFYQRVIDRARTSGLIIVNHALFFSLLSVRGTDEGSLFENDFVVFDEAHTLEGVAGQGIGKRVSRQQVIRAIHRLYNPGSKKGILAAERRSFRTACAEAVRAGNDFFERLTRAVGDTSRSGTAGARTTPHAMRLRGPLPVDDTLTGHLVMLRQKAAVLEKSTDNPVVRHELASVLRSLGEAQAVLEEFSDTGRPDLTYWIEVPATRQPNTSLCCTPTDLAAAVGPLLFREGVPAVLTSGTLAVQGSLAYASARIGARDAQTLILDSPFDHRRQMRIVLARDLAEPDSDAYLRDVHTWILRSIDRSGGRALVLFTSTALLRSVAAQLRPALLERGIRLLVQGEDGQRHTLLEAFRSDTSSVLFGLDTFWAGVDVPGEALEHVIITRLPFSVPNHPMVEARMECIAAGGGNPFVEFTLPEAILKFRQGAGRLIRSREDRGLLTVLDSRILHKSYGSAFLSSLPRCPVELLSRSGEVEEVMMEEW